MTTNTISITIN